MIFLNQIGLAVLLVTLAPGLHCAEIIVLIEWQKPRQAGANLLGHASGDIDGSNRRSARAHVLSDWRLWGRLENITLLCGISVSVLFALVTEMLDRDAQLARKKRADKHSVARPCWSVEF
ncbi:MAG TPA: hypothetical protein VEI49_05150 [Terriglobales bacterium]|nr:hypothetical protein [Terriglobales bacterium]